jgi:hypothetical protein
LIDEVTYCESYFKSEDFVYLFRMKSASKYGTSKPSKGERLNWPSLKEASAMPVTEELLQSRQVSEKEIETRHRSLNGQLSLLVP